MIMWDEPFVKSLIRQTLSFAWLLSLLLEQVVNLLADAFNFFASLQGSFSWNLVRHPISLSVVSFPDRCAVSHVGITRGVFVKDLNEENRRTERIPRYTLW